MIKPIIIIKAWINVFKGITTAKHKERYNVCKYCPSAEYKPYLDFINDELVDVKGMICNECKCPLVAKIRSNDKCNKW